MKKKFAYLFTLGSKIHWSGEDEKTILLRAGNADLIALQVFVWDCKVGEFHTLKTGEYIFRTE